MIGGVAVAIGAFALLYAVLADEPGRTSLVLAASGLGIGALLLGIGWIGALKYGHGGVGAIGGSLFVPLAFLYAYFHRDDFHVNAMLLALAFGAFTYGHALGKAPKATRVIAAIASGALTVQILALVANSHLPKNVDSFLGIVSLGGIAMVGVTLAILVPDLRGQPVDPDRI
jgi:hypothetical protein